MGTGLFCSTHRRQSDPYTTGNRAHCIHLQHAYAQTSRLDRKGSVGRGLLSNLELTLVFYLAGHAGLVPGNYLSCKTASILPAGSLNQAMSGP